MKKIIFFYFLAFSTLSFAQAKLISGTVKDINTKEPIDIVSISIVGTNISTVTNSEGEFRISVPEGSGKLSFSHISYTTSEYDVKDNDAVELFLTPKEYLLDEVVVNQQPTAVLAYEVGNTSWLKLIKTPALLNTYHREFVKKNGKYIRFTDGILDYYIHNNEKQGLTWSELSVKQSRIYDNRNLDVSEDEEKLESSAFQKVGSEFLEALKKINILSDTAHYDFHIKTKTDLNKNSIGIITITPKKDIKNTEDGSMRIGIISYDAKTKLILDIDLKRSPEHKKYPLVDSISDGGKLCKLKLNDFAYKISFRIDDDKYFLNYYQLKFNFDFQFFGEANNTFEYVSDVTTLDYNTVVKKPNKFKLYSKATLFENGNKYTDEFWKNQNIRLLNDEEENIIKTLNEKSATTAQGASN